MMMRASIDFYDLKVIPLALLFVPAPLFLGLGHHERIAHRISYRRSRFFTVVTHHSIFDFEPKTCTATQPRTALYRFNDRETEACTNEKCAKGVALVNFGQRRQIPPPGGKFWEREC